ncbi:dihydrofolate reductase family protein [Microbacterium tumbae]
MAGRIVIDLFTTLDGVAQGPGAPEEDTSGGFRFGGWQAGVESEAVGEQVIAGMKDLDALLLGRRTYDIFAGYWPQHTDGPAGGIGVLFNRVPKYVASRDAGIRLDWENSRRVGDDLVTEIARMRADHRDVHVIGSLDFVHTLLAGGLFDELTLWVYPILLGRGKKVFDDGALPTTLRLLGTPAPDGSGVVQLRYARIGDVPAVGVAGE